MNESNLCPLCEIHETCNINSHIVPKFFKKTLGNIYKFDLANYDPRRAQDIFKECHLLCEICEKSIGVLDRYFATYIYPAIKNPYNIENVVVTTTKRKKTAIISGIYEGIGSIFIQSIIYRMHISSQASDFSLDCITEGIIRENLLKVISLEQNKTIENYCNEEIRNWPIKYWSSPELSDKNVIFYPQSNNNCNYILFLNELRVLINNDFFEDPKDSTIKIDFISKKNWNKEAKEVLLSIHSGDWEEAFLKLNFRNIQALLKRC